MIYNALQEAIRYFQPAFTIRFSPPVVGEYLYFYLISEPIDFIFQIRTLVGSGPRMKLKAKFFSIWSLIIKSTTPRQKIHARKPQSTRSF